LYWKKKKRKKKEEEQTRKEGTEDQEAGYDNKAMRLKK